MSGAGDDASDGKTRLLFLYARLLSADRRGEDWRPVARQFLGVDPEADEEGARAKWLAELDKARVYWLGKPGSPSDE